MIWIVGNCNSSNKNPTCWFWLFLLANTEGDGLFPAFLSHLPSLFFRRVFWSLPAVGKGYKGSWYPVILETVFTLQQASQQSAMYMCFWGEASKTHFGLLSLLTKSYNHYNRQKTDGIRSSTLLQIAQLLNTRTHTIFQIYNIYIYIQYVSSIIFLILQSHRTWGSFL